MHTHAGRQGIYKQPQPANTERGLLPQVYDTSLDPNQLDLPDLPPLYLPVLHILYSIFSIVWYPVLFIVHFCIGCVVYSYVTSICRHLYNNVGGSRKSIRICSHKSYINSITNKQNSYDGVS